MEKKLTIGIVQQCNVANVEKNKQLLAENIRIVAAQGARLIVLQELHNSLYFCQSENVAFFDLAETIPGPSTAFFGKLARELGVVIVCSLFERRAAGLFHNTAVVIESDGSIAGTQKKMHIPDDPAYYEKFYFTPGDDNFRPIVTSLGKLGVQTCWDQWYPEGARLMALQGADILIYPTAIGYDNADSVNEKRRQREAWLTIQRSHAIANGLPLICANRTGVEQDSTGHTDGIKFWGSSFVCGQQGDILASAAEDKAENLVASVDFGRTDQVRRWWPFLRDRRIDKYSGLTRRYIDDDADTRTSK